MVSERMIWIRGAGVLLLFSLPLFSQSVEGTVTDPDGLPVTGAKVVLDFELSAWTDLLGRYSFGNVSPGRHVLRASSEDFEAVELQVEVPAGAGVEANIRFQEVRKAAASIEVVGEAEETLREIPGSVASISQEELTVSKPMDANEVLRRVPGVTLREDSGPVGLRLNVGIRGLNPDRSRKVLMLEDGIPIALAPYGEPDMYYSPPIDRMRRVEVLKGSGQIVHGPQTIGGVINFVTPEPPPSTHGSIDVEGGQRGFFAGNALVGGSTRDEKLGWLLNYLNKRGDGFRKLWFQLDDVQGKLTLKPSDRQTVGLKFGFYDETSNSTYLGLTQPQWEQDPNINVVPHDRLVVRRYSGSVTHTMVLAPEAIWSNAFYGYDTIRNWGRQDWDRVDKGRDYLSVEGDPSIPGGAVYLRDSAGNRNRAFRVFGGQSNVSWMHRLGPAVRGKLDAGARYIYERAEDLRINGRGYDARTGRLRDGEFRYGNALSGYVQQRFYLGSRIILTPGIRFERYRYERDIYRYRYRDVSARRADTILQPIPGLGVSVRAAGSLTFFAGVHRGFAPPRTKIAITSDGESLDLDAELSWNYEAGVRFRKGRLLEGELTFFRLDFENQIITAAESGGATTTLTNGGATLHQGLESSLRVNWNEFTGGSWLLYTDFRHMYLATAKFTRNELYQGNRLPYAPRQTFAVLIGARQRRGFGFQIDTSYVADQFGDNRQTVAPSADGTVGLLPAYMIWNFEADYTVRRERYEVSPYFTVKNLTNEIYIASRAPQGIQPGLFRQVNFGLRFTF